MTDNQSEALVRRIRKALGKYNDEYLPLVNLVENLRGKVERLEAENAELSRKLDEEWQAQ